MSIHPERIEVSAERSYPSFFCVNSAVWDYSERGKGTQGQNRKNTGKNAFFLRACAKRAGFMRVGAEGRGAESRFRLSILCNFKLIKEKADKHGPEGSCADGGVTRSGRRPFAVAFLERNLGTSK